jgi:sec-independent protein translocase protein TatC
MSEPSGAMPFLDHLEELRSRLLVSLAVVLVLSVVGYFLSDPVIAFVTRPVGKVYFMGVAEAFAVKIKVALFFGLFAGSPVVFFQAWRFVAPGLTAKEVKWVLPVALALSLFFVAGAAFCFYLVLPVGVEFLMGFATDSLVPMISVSRYISFVGWMTIAFGLVFELPVVIFLLGRMGVVSAQDLRRHRRFAIVAILVVAAIATPSPDAFSQLLLAGPLYLLFELSVALVAITGRKKGIAS